MSSTTRRSALAALDAARPVAARLEPSRHPEDTAADIIELWGTVETALRSLLGGSALAGQPLIHESRQRQLISFDVANRLAAFLAARDRVQRTEYRPVAGDVAVVRDGFGALQKELAAGPVTGDVVASPVAPQAPPFASAAEVDTATKRPRPRLLLGAVGGAVLLVVLIMAGVLVFGSRAQAGRAHERGVELYSRGSPEAARAKFEEALRRDASLTMPYVYLGRIARESGNLEAARRYLEQAVRQDQENATAMSELAKVMFVSGNYELARRFFVRAVQLDPSDRPAQGYLGCSLIRLGAFDSGTRFIQRAGPGPWTQCAPAMPQAAAPRL